MGVHAHPHRQGLRSDEPADHGPVALPPAAGLLANHPDVGSGAGHRLEIRGSRRRQAHLQPRQLRHRRVAARHGRGVDLSGAVGQPDVGGISVRVPGLPRPIARQARRHRHRLPRHLHRHSARARALPRRSARHPDEADAVRRPAALHLLHDHRSEDDTGSAQRAHAVRRARGGSCRLAAVCAPHAARADLRAVLRLPARPDPRSTVSPRTARRPLPMVPASPQLKKVTHMRKEMRPVLVAAMLACAVLPFADAAHAFCGFYVAKADGKLFNKASKVVVARKGEQTAVTMASDYQGDPKEFALVIPVPTVVAKSQIKVVDNALVDHLDAYSAPRLVEYFDPDPCRQMEPSLVTAMARPSALASLSSAHRDRTASLGVKIEAEYTIGEYDI